MYDPPCLYICKIVNIKKIYQEIRHQDIPLDLHLAHIILNECIRNTDLPMVKIISYLNLYLVEYEIKHPFNLVTYTSFMDGYLKRKDLASALKIKKKNYCKRS